MAGAVPAILLPLLSRLRIALPQIARLGVFLSNAEGTVLSRWADSDGQVLVCPPAVVSVAANTCLAHLRAMPEASFVDRNDPAMQWLPGAHSEPLMVLSVRRNSVVHGYLVIDVERGWRADAACIVQLRSWGPILAALLGHSIQSTANLVNAVRFSNEFIHARDPITGEHQLRMGAFLHVLASEMNRAHGFMPGFADEVAVFGALHDIGKVAVPDYVLLKPGRFEATEWEVMKAHVEKGAALVRRMLDESGIRWRVIVVSACFSGAFLPALQGEDTLVKRPITIPFDMVVHAIGMDPNVDNMTLSAVFGVDLHKQGYIARRDAYGIMGATSRPGVLVAGAAIGPETIDDSIAQGQAAALSAMAAAGARAFSGVAVA